MRWFAIATGLITRSDWPFSRLLLGRPGMAAAMESRVMTNRNMNWLIHELYTRKDFALCKKLIDRQLTINYDKEFLYYTKVRSKGGKAWVRGKMWDGGVSESDEKKDDFTVVGFLHPPMHRDGFYATRINRRMPSTVSSKQYWRTKRTRKTTRSWRRHCKCGRWVVG